MICGHRLELVILVDEIKISNQMYVLFAPWSRYLHSPSYRLVGTGSEEIANNKIDQ